MTQAEKAQLLLELHSSERPLVLPNAWDVASARIFEEAGFPAIATTSAGIANTLGYADGERISRAEMLDMVARIARAVRVPVTADVESGYGDTAATIAAVIEAGAVGVNLEDSYEGALVAMEQHCDVVRRARAAAEEHGVHVVINARTDPYLGGGIAAENRFDETLRRGRAYRDAGADCIFAPGLVDEKTIAALVKALDAPLNILATTGAPPAARLGELGVARVSVGSGAMRAAMGFTRRIAADLRTATWDSMLTGAMSYIDANTLFLNR